MIDSASSSQVYKIAEREFVPQLQAGNNPDLAYKFTFPKESIRRIGTAIRSAQNPGEELSKFIDRIITDPAISDRLFSPAFFDYSIFKGLTGSLLAELLEDYRQKLRLDLVSANPMIAKRAAAVMTTMCTTAHGFPDFPSYLHCFFKFDGLTAHQLFRKFEDHLKPCKNQVALKREVSLIQKDLEQVATELHPVVGKIDSHKLKTQKAFDSMIAEINLNLARKTKNALRVLDLQSKAQITKKVLGMATFPKAKIRVISLEQEAQPAGNVKHSVEIEPIVPDFISLAKDASLLTQVPPLMHKRCSASFINGLCQKNLPLETQVRLLNHLQIIASWPETDHLGVFKSLFELNNPSHKQLGIYYLLQLPEQKLLPVLDSLLTGDRKSGDLKRRLDVNVFKVAASFLKKDLNFKESLADIKIDLIAAQLRVGYIPSYHKDFWEEAKNS